MKKMKKQAKNIVSVLLLLISFIKINAQTPGDTVKTGKPNDRMTVKPAHPNDDMSMKNGKTNDANSIMTDTGFIRKNIMDNLMEIRLSTIALNKGTGPQIKKIANTMIAGHTAMLNELKKFAASKKLSLKSNDLMSPLPQETMKPSKDFNKIWATQMLTMHDDKITELENFMPITQDAQLKALIAKSLITIKMHRKMLAEIPGVSVTAGSKVLASL